MAPAPLAPASHHSAGHHLAPGRASLTVPPVPSSVPLDVCKPLINSRLHLFCFRHFRASHSLQIAYNSFVRTKGKGGGGANFLTHSSPTKANPFFPTLTRNEDLNHIRINILHFATSEAVAPNIPPRRNLPLRAPLLMQNHASHLKSYSCTSIHRNLRSFNILSMEPR